MIEIRSNISIRMQLWQADFYIANIYNQTYSVEERTARSSDS